MERERQGERKGGREGEIRESEGERETEGKREEGRES